MKKILMVTEPFYGGIFAYVSQLCNLLCDKYEIYWAYTMHPKTPKNYRRQIDPHVHLVEIEMTRNLMNIKEVISSVKTLRRIEREIQPDLIHLHSSVAGGLGRIAYNGKNNSVVYTPHAYSFVVMGDNTLKCKMYKLMERILSRTKSTVLTCCESEDEVARKLSSRTAYIETGIDLAKLEGEIEAVPVKKRRGFTVYTVSRACAQKRPELFNEIASLVPEANFLWIGDGDSIGALTAPNIEKPGWKPREEAYALARSADVFVLCSYGEAIAMSLLENMYLKKLCIVSNTMGNKSVIHDGVNGYVCTTAQEYAERIREAMKNFPIQIPERAKEDVEMVYTMPNMRKKFIEFYDEKINGRGGYNPPNEQSSQIVIFSFQMPAARITSERLVA